MACSFRTSSACEIGARLQAEVHDDIDATITASASIVIDRIMESSRAIGMSRST